MVGSFFGLCKSWKNVKTQEVYKDEMIKQIDVQLLLHRFNFLERAVEVLLKGNMIKENSFYLPENIEALKQRRRKYRKYKKMAASENKVEGEKSEQSSEESSDSESDSD